MNERLKSLRKTLQLSQEEFGKRLGVTNAAISKLEAGINQITEQMIRAICHEFNVDYIWLTTGEGEMFYTTSEVYIGSIGKKERLSILRNSLNLSQQEIGNKIGVTRSSISRLESGVSNFTEQMIKSICNEFNVNYTWFTTGEGEMFVAPKNDYISLVEQIISKENESTRQLIHLLLTLDKDDLDALNLLLKLDQEDLDALNRIINKITEQK